MIEDKRPPPIGRGSLRTLMRRKSTVAFLMTLPLITLIAALVAYPTGFAVYLSMLDRSTARFIGLGNFTRLASSDRFWTLVSQTCLYALIAVTLSAIIGFVVAHLVNNIPTRRQRKWRGMLLLPWVIPLAMSVPAWRLLFDPSFSPINWILEHVGIGRINWFVDAGWARFESPCRGSFTRPPRSTAPPGGSARGTSPCR